MSVGLWYVADGGGAGIRRFRAFGRGVEVSSEDPRLFALLGERLPPFRRLDGNRSVDLCYAVTTSPDGARLSVDGRRPRAPRDLLATAQRIVRHLQLDLARHAPGVVFVHAGVVRLRGVAVVIPGRSFSGKSTLVAAFCAAGAAYASDEFAVIDEKARVHPYPRPLALRRHGGVVERVDPSTLVGGVVRRPCRVGLLLLPRYRPAARWKPQELSPAKALLELMRHTVGGRSRPDEVLTTLRRVVGEATAWQGERGDAASVVAGVAAVVDRLAHVSPRSYPATRDAG